MAGKCLYLWIVTTLALTIVIQDCVCNEDISMDVSGAKETSPDLYHAMGGANLVLHCHIPMSPDEAEDASVGLTKVVEDSSGDQSLVSVASSTELEAGFTTQDIPRYYLNHTVEDEGHTTHLYITDAAVEDSGDYLCGIETEPMKDQAKVTLKVIKDVTSVEMSLDGTITDDGEKDLDAPTMMAVRCVASGSNPEPGIKLMQGEGDEAMDITYLLKNATVTNDRTATEVNGNGGLLKVEYEGTLEGQLEVNARMSEDKLSCHASVPQSETPAVASAGYTFQFEGGLPKFDASCGSEFMAGYKQETKVTCKVTADPEITKTYFYWYQWRPVEKDDEIKKVENQDQKVILEPMKQLADNKMWGRNADYFGIVHNDTDGATVMELEVARMHSQMYRRHFMVAENAHGETEYEFTFTEDPDRPIMVSSAPSLCRTTVASLVLPLAVLLLSKLS